MEGDKPPRPRIKIPSLLTPHFCHFFQRNRPFFLRIVIYLCHISPLSNFLPFLKHRKPREFYFKISPKNLIVPSPPIKMYHQQKNKNAGRHGQNHHHDFSIPTTTIPLFILLLASVWLLISATISTTSTVMVHGMALNQQQREQQTAAAAALDDDGNAANNNNNNAAMMNGKSCIIRVEKIDEFKGKCTRLGDGTGKLACQTEFYLDPNNEDCARKEEEEENEEEK